MQLRTRALDAADWFVWSIPVRDYLGSVLPGLGGFKLTPAAWATETDRGNPRRGSAVWLARWILPGLAATVPRRMSLRLVLSTPLVTRILRNSPTLPRLNYAIFRAGESAHRLHFLLSGCAFGFFCAC